MADYISMKQVPGGTVTATDDRILYDYALSSGIIYGCGISYLGNNMIHINAGYGIIKGGLFEMQDHTEYVDYSSSGTVNGQIYLHFDASADDKLTIVKQTAASLKPMVQNANANYDGGIYEIQLCTFKATTTNLNTVQQTFKYSTVPIDVLDTLEAVIANTTNGKAAGAKAVKELNTIVNNALSTKVTGFKSGNYAAVTGLAYDSTNKKLGLKVGADTIIPFSSLTLPSYVVGYTFKSKNYGDGSSPQHWGLADTIIQTNSRAVKCNINMQVTSNPGGRVYLYGYILNGVVTTLMTDTTSIPTDNTYNVTIPANSSFMLWIGCRHSDWWVGGYFSILGYEQ